MKKIIITGGSGFLGTQIINKLLVIGGYEVVIMDVFPPKNEREHVTFYKKNLMEAFDIHQEYPELKNPYAVIHLAGKSIYGRFTKKHKQDIWDSRINASRNLVNLIAREEYKPHSLVAASAVGFYGDQPGEIINESSDRKNYYFLSDVVEAWEKENIKAQDFGVQVCCIRNGHIIGQGGILSEVASTFSYKIGGILGSGKEYFPWIDIRDLVDLYIKALESNMPLCINGVSNTLATQKDFSHAIGKVKKTLIYMHIYKWMLSLKFGSFAKEMLVNQKIKSQHFENINFKPSYDILDDVIRYYLTQQK